MKTADMLEIAAMKEAINSRILEEVEHSIKQCELTLETLVKEDEEIKATYELIRTVEGVGLLVGVYLIVATKNFQSFTNSRKFACQIGIAPFQKLSGSSIRINKGVSHFSDKYGKKIITNSVGCAIRKYGGLRTYYVRKVGEGKSEGQVLNACKNKLLHRIFAVVKTGVPYDKFHQFTG